jgi:hypothetical protein
MRKALGVAALALALAGPSVQAQSTQFLLGRATAGQPIVNVPIDTSQAIASPGLPNMTPGFSLTNLFSGFHLPSFTTLIGQSPYPAPSSFPSTHYPNKFQPVRPIIPGQ